LLAVCAQGPHILSSRAVGPAAAGTDVCSCPGRPAAS